MAAGGSFTGYSRKGVAWLRAIAARNAVVQGSDRDWYQEHRTQFEDHVRAPTHALVADLDARLARFAPDWVVDPARAVQRIHRDLRFTTDRRPYKPGMVARFGRLDAPRGAFAGLRISVAHDGVEVMGGTWQPAGSWLRSLRAAVAADAPRLRALASRRALREAMGELQGARLARVPAPHAQDHPAADLLRRRQLYFHAVLPPSLLRERALVAELARRFRLLAPFTAWVEHALTAT